MLLTPSLCHKLSHFLGPPPPSVTYFMDGPIKGLYIYIRVCGLNSTFSELKFVSIWECCFASYGIAQKLQVARNTTRVF